jgi:hypothetical protein
VNEALRLALRVEDQTQRMLEVAAVVQEELEDLGIHPVVVGGLAVAYWTTGAFLSSDIDVVMPASPEVDKRMEALGFNRQGRYWTLPDSDIIFEAPGSTLEEGDEATEVQLGSGRIVTLLRAEDALVHRIRELVATPRVDVLEQAVTLLKAPGLNQERLLLRTSQANLEEGLRVVRELAENIEAGQSLEAFELHDRIRNMGD